MMFEKQGGTRSRTRDLQTTVQPRDLQATVSAYSVLSEHSTEWAKPCSYTQSQDPYSPA